MKHLGKLLCVIMLVMPPAALAKDSLGVFNNWGAFRDPDVPRCYAIAESEEITGKATRKSYASVGFFPERGIRAQFLVL
ncbi:MAG: hypothetical protein AAGM33_05570, partial [Pseudomonadota bacterium]